MDGFIATLPLRILIINPKLDDDGKLIFNRSTQIISGKPKTGPSIFAIFTDDDLAERYLKQIGVTAEIVEIDTIAEIVDIAQKMKTYYGVEQVALDPTVSTLPLRVTLVPVDVFISNCKSSEADSESAES